LDSLRVYREFFFAIASTCGAIAVYLVHGHYRFLIRLILIIFGMVALYFGGLFFAYACGHNHFIF